MDTNLVTIFKQEGVIQGRDSREVDIVAPASGVLLITLKQSGIDLHLEVTTSEASEPSVFESETGRDGEDLAVVAVEQGRTYVMRITSDVSKGVSGRFVLDVRAAADSPPALRLLSDASQTSRLHRGVARADAAERGGLLLAKAGDRRAAGLARLSAARNLYQYESDAVRTAALAQLAINDLRAANEPLLLAKALETKAGALLDSSDRTSMIDAQIKETLAEAQSLYLEHAAQAGYAEAEIYRGLHAFVSGNRTLAAELWRKALSACVDAREPVCESRATQNLGVLARDAGDYSSALELLSFALTRIERSEDPGLYADINDNLAFALRSVGGYDEALQRHSIAALAYTERGRCADVGRSLYGMAYSLLGIGNTTQAIRFYKLVLSSACDESLRGELAARDRSIPSQSASAASWSDLCRPERPVGENRDERNNMLWTAWDLGNLLRSMGHASSSLKCHELALTLATSPNYRLGVQLEIVEDHLKLGEDESAASLLREISPAFASSPGSDHGRDWYRARSYELEGDLALLHDATDRAIDSYQRALLIHEKQQNPEGRFEALRRIAEAHVRSQRPGEAHAYFLKADSVLEEIRTSSLDPVFRASLFDVRREMYAKWVAALQQRPIPATRTEIDLALELLAISERGRGRTLIQLITDHTESAELQAFKRAQRPASTVLGQFLAAASSEELSHAIREHFQTSDAGAAQAQLAQTKTRIVREHDIESAAERISAYRQQLPVSAAVIEYLIGAEQSTAWVIRRERIQQITLPPASVIRSAVTLATSAFASGASDQQVQQAMGRLYDVVLRPLKDAIGSADLMIAPDDALYGVPFAALWNAEDQRYLIEERAVSMIPSIQFMLSRSTEDARGNQTGKALIVGDPVYDSDDAAARCGKAEGRGRRAGMARLRQSGAEAAKVAALFGQASARDVTSLMACSANRQVILRQPLAEFTHLHFATHASVDSLIPHNSAIHLSVYDERGLPTDAELTVTDLLNERLAAELVVLSGCATAAGQEFKGEGALSLSFAVLASGSRRVMSTLWPVADSPAADLIEEFYEALLVGRQSPATALRMSQLSLMRESRWRAPKYWAAYVITG